MSEQCAWTGCREDGAILISLGQEEYSLCRGHLGWVQGYMGDHTEGELSDVKESGEMAGKRGDEWS